MNTQQLKKLLMTLGYSFAEFENYMIGKVRLNRYTYQLEHIEQFLYLKAKDK